MGKLKPLVRKDSYFANRELTPLVIGNGYTTDWGANGVPIPWSWKTVTGSLIHIIDALVSPVNAMTVNIDPVQDLNGYDNPWPAGGGKNLYNIDDASIGTTNTYLIVNVTANTDYVFSVNAQQNALYIQWDNNGTWASLKTAYGASWTTFNSGEHTQLRLQTYSTTAVPTKFQLELGTSPTAWVPYSNICPISGWTGVKVTRTGKNLLDDSTLVHGGLNSSNGTESVTDQRVRTDYISLKAGTYTVSRTSNSIITRCTLCVYDMNENYLFDESYVSSWNALNFTFTLTADRLVRFAFAMATNDTIDLDSVTGTLQLESGSTATAYEPYTGTTIPVSFGEAGTVYGGTLDVINGVLTVTMASVDLGTLEWTANTRNGRTRFATVSLRDVAAKPTTTQERTAFLCSELEPDSAPIAWLPTSKNSTISFYSDATLYALYDDAPDAAAFTTAMSGVQLVYKLATPVTYQLTASEVTTLLGENNLWADTGDTTLTYMARG